jgi:hypothetical protein
MNSIPLKDQNINDEFNQYKKKSNLEFGQGEIPIDNNRSINLQGYDIGNLKEYNPLTLKGIFNGDVDQDINLKIFKPEIKLSQDEIIKGEIKGTGRKSSNGEINPTYKKKTVLRHKLRNNTSANEINSNPTKDKDNNNIHPKKSRFYPNNVKDYEHKNSNPIDKIELTNYKNSNNNKINFEMHRSPMNFTKNRMHFYNLNRTEKKEDEKIPKRNIINSPKEFISPRNKYKTFSRLNKSIGEKIDENEEEKKYIIDKKNNDINANLVKSNYTNKRTTTKHKVVKETQNIILKPGETIKPKSITKRQLKPHTTIVRNEFGKESIVTENTLLTTVIVNELVEPSKNRRNKNPQDGQLVKQYITKIYKTEIETLS